MSDSVKFGEVEFGDVVFDLDSQLVAVDNDEHVLTAKMDLIKAYNESISDDDARIVRCSVCSRYATRVYMMTTPCCIWTACLKCWTGKSSNLDLGWKGTLIAVVPGKPVACLGCGKVIADAEEWKDVLLPANLTFLAEAVEAAAVAEQVPLREIPESDQKAAWWLSGQYIHGCGTAFTVASQCDVLDCPNPSCYRKNINIIASGGHTFQVKGLFESAKKFTRDSTLEDLDRLKEQYPDVWKAMYLSDLVTAIKGGDTDGWTEKMFEDTWGRGFLDFLTDKVKTLPKS